MLFNFYNLVNFLGRFVEYQKYYGVGEKQTPHLN